VDEHAHDLEQIGAQQPVAHREMRPVKSSSPAVSAVGRQNSVEGKAFYSQRKSDVINACHAASVRSI
jgi:hypothetical protein